MLDGENEIAVSHNVVSIQPDLDECKWTKLQTCHLTRQRGAGESDASRDAESSPTYSTFMLPKLAASCVNESMNNVRNSLEHCVTKPWFKQSRWWLIHVFPSGLTKAVYAYCRDRAVLRTHTRILALTHLYSPEADTGSYTCLCPSCAKMARLRSSGLTRFAHVSVWESLLAW